MSPTLTAAERKAMKLVVSQWRASHGPRGQRLGWAPAEAASIAEIPTRTLIHWKSEGVVEPSVLWPAAGLTKPMYCAWDLLVARMVLDLTEFGTPRKYLNIVAGELSRRGMAEAVGKDPLAPPDDEESRYLDIRQMADWKDGSWIFFPSDGELAEEALSMHGELTHFCTAEQASHINDELGHFVTTYPLGQVAADLVVRVDAWWDQVNSDRNKRPPWM